MGGESVAGGKLKESGYTNWQSPNTGATNESGFTGLPGGYRFSYGTFSYNGTDGAWWSSSVEGQYGWNRGLHYQHSNSFRDLNGLQDGFSVRCLKD